MLGANGGEDALGDAGYLVLWPAEDLASMNDCYAVRDFAPGLVLFGSDGGDTAYAFDTRPDPDVVIVEVPFTGISPDAAEPIGATFGDFLRHVGSR